jgi:hypothetical protein
MTRKKKKKKKKTHTHTHTFWIGKSHKHPALAGPVCIAAPTVKEVFALVLLFVLLLGLFFF